MATAAIAGYTGWLYSAASTGTLARIAEVREFSVTEEMTEIDATSHDSSGHREVIAGIRRWSGTAAYLYAGDNATQKEMFNVLVGGIQCDFEFYPAGSSGTFPIFTGTGYVTSWELSGPNEDAMAQNLAFVGTEALAMSTS
jgi:predicted secreted protein